MMVPGFSRAPTPKMRRMPDEFRNADCQSRKHLGAVVLGASAKGKLRHYGYAGSGFTEKGLKDAVDRMKPLFIDKCPFVNPPNIKERSNGYGLSWFVRWSTRN
jgi:hypothetical protein